jgi:hypothetical protein
MGVMGCSRKGCGNAMCDTYVNSVAGYICDDCKSEFEELIGDEELPVSRMVTKLEIFLSKRKKTFELVNVQEFFNRNIK